MEQNQSPVSEQAKHISAVQILAFIFGITSCVTAFAAAAFSLWNIFMTVAKLSSDSPSVAAGTVLILIALLCGLAAVVLGVIGLLLDRKKRQKTTGLVFSVIGIWLGAAGLVFLLCIVFWTFFLQTILRMIGV